MQAKKLRRKLIFFCWPILKATDGKSRIRIRKSSVWIQGSGSAPKFHGSVTLVLHILMPINDSFDTFFQRRMTDSYDAAIIPLGSDTQLRDR
jgi:hypothetical protein